MWWNDLAAMAEALSTLAPHTDPDAEVSPRATLHGAVRIGAGSRICDGAHVQGPVSIGRDCLIGANVSIGFALLGDRVKDVRVSTRLTDSPACVVLEEYEHAKARGANILAELIGFGMSDDAYHITSPSEGGEGAAAAMRNALRDAGLNPEQVDYINAHGTSTPAGDVAETRAIESVFGDHARRLAVSSTKSMTGHLLGAAGGVEAIFSVLALRDQVLPPTINLDNPDPACTLDYVPHTARDAKLDVVLSNSFGFGGTNGSLIFRRV